MTEYLTPEEIAAALKVHPRTILRAIRARGLRATSVANSGGGNSWRVHPDDLDAWLEQRANTDRAPGPIDLQPIAQIAARPRTPRRAGTGHLTVTEGMGAR